jgi:hypothetical protein
MNPALQNFINMRQRYTAGSSSKKEPARSMYQMPKPESKLTLGSIIQDTPSDKDVKEYFKNRILELVAKREEKEAEDNE